MFQPNRMNEIDNFFMRNNNQVTPKRSYSPHLAPSQVQQNLRAGSHLQYFPSNKQNFLPNRTSVSPNKLNFARKPMINGPGSNINNIMAPSLLVSPRNKGSHQGLHINSNQGYSNNHGGFQQELSRPQLNVKNQGNGSSGLLKKLNNNSNQVQFVMSKGVEYCQNHTNKIAQFSINIEGEKMKYCSVCASKLASQGFTVLKIVNQSQKSVGLSLRKPKPLPGYPEYRGNPFYQEITKFLRQLVGVQGHHYETINKFNNLEQHYQDQIDITTQYYDEVIKILTEMKEQHLQDLNEQKQKYLQIGDIQADYLNQNVEEITYMREDIETNIPSIVTDIEEDSFNQCVYEYRQKLAMLKHSIEEKQQNLKDVTSYTEELLKKKVEDFQNAMKQLWSEQNSEAQPHQNAYQKRQSNRANLQKQQPVSIKNMHDMLPKSSVQQTQGQGAFRHLFGDDQDNNDQTLPIPSPQFKKI